MEGKKVENVEDFEEDLTGIEEVQEDVSREAFDGDILEKIKQFLLIDAVEKDISEYENHTLNLDGHESTPYGIRFIEGYTDSLNLNIFDLFRFIYLRFFKKSGVKNESNHTPTIL